MKKTKIKRITALLLVMIIGVTSLVITPQKITAKSYDPNEDIWESVVDEQQNIISLIADPLFAIGFSNYIYNNMKTDQVCHFDFSKASKRRYILKWMGMNIVDMGEQIDYNSAYPNEISKWLFGKGTSNIPRITGDVGDWFPSIGAYDRLMGLYRVGQNKYKYTKSVYMCDYNSYDYEQIGFVEYTLKRSSKYHYGWIVTKAKVTKL